MEIRRFRFWRTFREELSNYATGPASTRAQWWFRGQADERWQLHTTLDRTFSFADDDDRDRAVANLLDEFRRQLLYLGSATHEFQGEALELFARHQGLPSPLLDWSESPFIASYFAFQGALMEGSSNAAVLAIDREKLPSNLQGLELIDDSDLLSFNSRALHQRGVFVRVSTIAQTSEELLGDALTKFVIPSEEAASALAELDELTINSTYLFGDAQSAAATAELRFRIGRN